MKLEEIDCPGDTLSYNCSIESNTENLHLTWSVEFPDQLPIEITYDYDSSMAVDLMDDMDITSTLVDIRDGYIQSVITLVVLNASMNGTTVECRIAQLDYDKVVIPINTSG